MKSIFIFSIKSKFNSYIVENFRIYFIVCVLIVIFEELSINSSSILGFELLFLDFLDLSFNFEWEK